MNVVIKSVGSHESVRVKRRTCHNCEHFLEENCQANGEKQQSGNTKFMKRMQWL